MIFATNILIQGYLYLLPDRKTSKKKLEHAISGMHEKT